MILAMWIAVRMTFIALEPDFAAEVADPPRARRPNRPARPAPETALTAAPVPLQFAPHEAPNRAGLASLAAPDELQRLGVKTAWQSSAAAAEGTALPIAVAAAACASEDCAGKVRARGTRPPPPPFVPLKVLPGRSQASRPRWTADGWVLLRGADSAPGLAAGAASYGGSQAGAVLRYALAPGSGLRPQAYARISAALGGPVRQSESAFGLMLRPVRHLPLAVMGELRVQESNGPARARPVVMAVTELPPLRLPLGADGEFYAQGGWAGGRDATAFYDLAATVQRRIADPLRGFRLSAGGGLWSGGQRGAARLDVGPRIEVRTMFGPSSRRMAVRIGADWRFRVAGRAQPGSGPALTLSAGF
ncbi:hypothetical protein [Novosphingobium sp.]|uniref:hypothetical protein n=1 Tax=Novosphingobium sp. TaxID=1874826 RepID=UPI0030179054